MTTNDVQTIGYDKVVQLHYRLTTPTGDVIDASPAESPSAYLHGHQNILPGIEEALEGSAVGERIEAVIPPDKAYGEPKATPMKLARSNFPADAELVPGVRVVLETPEGEAFPVYVSRVVGADVYLTPDHPLAGVSLHFDGTVASIRDATEQERQDGWPEPEGGSSCGCC